MQCITLVFSIAALCVGHSSAASLVCGGSSSSKNIGLVSPSLPPRVCQYTISAYSSYVCQLRIDFAMTLAQPSLPNGVNGLSVPECVDDYLLIGDLKLCGVETSQHIYIPFNRTAGVKNVDITIVTSARSGGSKLPSLSWNLQVTQLECPSGSALRSVDDAEGAQARSIKDGFLVAPAGCNQYFPYEQGTIQSFNYNGGKGIFPYHLNYAICFRRTTSTVGLAVKASDFHLGNEEEARTSLLMETDNFCYPQVFTDGEAENYLMIPQATVVDSDIRASYFCGSSLEGHTILSTNPGPLLMIFNSDGIYEEGVTAQGFELDYTILSK